MEVGVGAAENCTENEMSLKNFTTIRQRGTRSFSIESVHSRISETGSETLDDLFESLSYLPTIPFPSPVYQSENDDVNMEEKSSDHAKELCAHLEVASTFGKVSSMCLSAKLEQEEEANQEDMIGEVSHFCTDSLHQYPKIRRSSSPCLSYTVPFFSKLGESEENDRLHLRSNGNGSDSMPYQVHSTANTSHLGFHHAPAVRKRSWANCAMNH